jgi:predicted RNA-binding protein with PUA-like domain
MRYTGRMAQYWLLKSEPESFSIDTMRAAHTTRWSGVRNYQARNYMRTIQVGDLCLFYHSNVGIHTGVTGVVQVTAPVALDETALDPAQPYFDAACTPQKCAWECVEVTFVEQFKQVIPLTLLKANPALEGMPLLQKGSRLSVQPVSKKHFEEVLLMRTE